MNEEQLKALADAREAIKLAHDTEMKSVNTKLTENETAVVSLQAELKALKEAKKEAPVEIAGGTDLRSALTRAFSEQKSVIAEIVKSGRQSAPLNIEIKAAVDIFESNTILSGGSNQYSLTQDTGIISTIRKRSEIYLANVSVGTIGTENAHWIEEVDEQGNPLFIAEGTASPQLSVRYEGRTMSCRKVMAFGKVGLELLADLPQLINYIMNNVMKRLDLKTETALLTGTGVGDELKGLTSYATPFVAGSLALQIPLANEFDVLVAMANQVDIAYGGIDKAVYVHPSTWALMMAIKTTTGEPLYKNYYDVVNKTYAGVKILESTMVTAGDFIGGDLSVVNVLFRSQLSITIGLDGNDLTNDKKTLVAKKRLVQFVSANDTQVLVKGTFATAKAALLKP